MKLKKKRKVECETCWRNAVQEVVADDLDDAPANFTMTRTCSGQCPKTYLYMTAQEMHKQTGLPLTGWS